MPNHHTTARPLGSAIMILLASLTLWWWLGSPVPIAEPLPQGRLQCASYTPLIGDETPADLVTGVPIAAERLRADLTLLHGHFDCVRTYSVTGLEHLPAVAQELGMQVLLGAWVNGDARNSRIEIEGVVQMASAWPQTVRAVIVGNEVLLRQELSDSQLAAYIREVNERVSQPVTYADVWEFQLRNPQVSAAVDFITIHILPYWEDEPVAIDNAVAHVEEIYALVAEKFPGRELLIGETGWPSRGRMREGALPSTQNEARFVRGFLAAAAAHGWRYNLVEALDQPWKRGQEGTVGGYWGLYDSARNDKGIINKPISNHPHWMIFGLAASTLGIALLLLSRRGAASTSPLLVTAIALVGGNLLGLQLEQYQTDVRYLGEMFLAALLLSLSFAATLGGLRTDSTALSWRAALQALRQGRLTTSAYQLALVAVTTAIAVAIIADPRYRSFPAYALLLPALLYVASAWRLRSQRQSANEDGREEWLLGGLLGLCAVTSMLQEGPHNWQAGLWIVALLLLSAGALISAQRLRRKVD